MEILNASTFHQHVYNLKSLLNVTPTSTYLKDMMIVRHTLRHAHKCPEIRVLSHAQNFHCVDQSSSSSGTSQRITHSTCICFSNVPIDISYSKSKSFMSVCVISIRRCTCFPRAESITSPSLRRARAAMFTKAREWVFFAMTSIVLVDRFHLYLVRFHRLYLCISFILTRAGNMHNKRADTKKHCYTVQYEKGGDKRVSSEHLRNNQQETYTKR